MMGIPISEFYEMTEYEFTMYKVGYQKGEIAAWERTRFIAWTVVATQSTKPPKIQDFLPLPIDQERKAERDLPRRAAKVSKQKFINIAEKLGIKDKVWQAQ